MLRNLAAGLTVLAGEMTADRGVGDFVEQGKGHDIRGASHAPLHTHPPIIRIAEKRYTKKQSWAHRSLKSLNRSLLLSKP